MTKVRRAAGAVVLPLVAAAVGIGVGATPADAAICLPLASAAITGPSGTINAGETVHARARVSGLLLKAHLQIAGPGLDQQIGPSASNGVIEGDVRVPKPGVFTLTVVGNGTGCVYDNEEFSVKPRPSAAKPTPHRTPRGSSVRSTPPRASKLPGRVPDSGSMRLRTPGSASPFRLPPVTPDGSGPSLRLPSSDPQVAAPPVPQSQPRAKNAAETVPSIKWGPSIAIALVLLLLSAHMGMWSRRQRLAEAGATRRGRGPRRPVDADPPARTATDGDDRSDDQMRSAIGTTGRQHPAGSERRVDTIDWASVATPPSAAGSTAPPPAADMTAPHPAAADMAKPRMAAADMSKPRATTADMAVPQGAAAGEATSDFEAVHAGLAVHDASGHAPRSGRGYRGRRRRN